jgi:hypothetical protein
VHYEPLVLLNICQKWKIMMGSLKLVSNFQLKALFNSHNANIDAKKDNLEKHMGKWQGECDIFN